MGFVDVKTKEGAEMKREVVQAATLVASVLVDIPPAVAANALIRVLGALIVQGAEDPLTMVERVVECLRLGVDENV